MKCKAISLLHLIYFLVNLGCERPDVENFTVPQTAKISIIITGFRSPLSPLEINILAAGMVDIKTIDTSIAVDIRYASINNFLKINFYKDLKKAYLQKDVALKLSRAQAYLKEKHPSWSLIILDAARPLRFQQQIWDSVKLPIKEKTKYVSNPKNGSLHNFGAAVDVSIIDENKIPLDMGCPYDSLSPIAYPMLEQEFLSRGILSEQQINNRRLLRQVMQCAGFYNIQTEWWHFNSCTRAEAIRKYKMIK